MKETEINKITKKARETREDFRKQYNIISKKFNELSIDMDNFLTNMCMEEENNEDEEKV